MYTQKVESSHKNLIYLVVCVVKITKRITIHTIDAQGVALREAHNSTTSIKATVQYSTQYRLVERIAQDRKESSKPAKTGKPANQKPSSFSAASLFARIFDA